jgi:hypothetical protein
MSKNNLMLLSVVAAVMVVWAVIQSHYVHSRTQSPQRKSFEESYLIQGLNLSSIAAIQIGTGAEPVKLVRQGEQFVVANKQNYPADTAKVNSLLVDVVDLKVSEFVTNDPQNHAALKVTEETAQNLIRFFDKTDTLITGVIIGDRRAEGEGPGASRTYVRLMSSNEVYLTDHVPNAPDSAVAYTDKTLLKLEQSDIKSVAVSAQDSNYVLKSGADQTQPYLLDHLPEGRQLKESAAESLVSALTNVAFTDVKKDSGAQSNLKIKGTVVCEVKDQVSYTLEILEQGDAYYVRAAAKYLNSTQIVKENRVESDEELKAKEAKLLARDQAEMFTNVHRGWLYEIAKWKADALTKPLADLLEDIKTPEETAAPDSTEQSSTGRE